MKETSKAHSRRITNWAFVNRYFVGRGLDVGADDDPLKTGDWPNITEIVVHTLPDGSNEKLSFDNETFDFVYSSNCLEHMLNTEAALSEWIRVCRTAGHVIFTVPDFELYEQGVWPSRWNEGHKHKFSIRTVIDMLTGLPVIIKKVELVDTGYDYLIQGADQTLPETGAEAFIEVVIKKHETFNTNMG